MPLAARPWSPTPPQIPTIWRFCLQSAGPATPGCLPTLRMEPRRCRGLRAGLPACLPVCLVMTCAHARTQTHTGTHTLYPEPRLPPAQQCRPGLPRLPALPTPPSRTAAKGSKCQRGSAGDSSVAPAELERESGPQGERQAGGRGASFAGPSGSSQRKAPSSTDEALPTPTHIHIFAHPGTATRLHQLRHFL